MKSIVRRISYRVIAEYPPDTFEMRYDRKSRALAVFHTNNRNRRCAGCRIVRDVFTSESKAICQSGQLHEVRVP